MHHSIKSFLLFLAVVLIAFNMAGCSIGTGGVDFQLTEYETDNGRVQIYQPRFKNFSDSEFQDKLNKEYDELVKRWQEIFLENSEKSALTECELSIQQEVKLKNKEFLSLVGDAYSFTSGIHGTSRRVAKNIDLLNNKELKLVDLFMDEGYEEALNNKISDILEKNPDKYSDLWENPVLSKNHQEDFYLSDKGLVLFYPPYELSYYARGFVEFCIPYKELSGYLKDEYKSLMSL